MIPLGPYCLLYILHSRVFLRVAVCVGSVQFGRFVRDDDGDFGRSVLCVQGRSKRRNQQSNQLLIDIGSQLPRKADAVASLSLCF